jgi:hypothetical protein
VKVIAADEGKLPDIGSQSTVQERIIPEQIPSISQTGRGMWKGFTAPKELTVGSDENVSGGLWKYSLPTGEQKQFATDAAKALGDDFSIREIKGSLELDISPEQRNLIPQGATVDAQGLQQEIFEDASGNRAIRLPDGSFQEI